MLAQQRRPGKRERRSANDTLRTFYRSWLFRFEEDNDRFFDQVARSAESRQQPPRQIAPAEYRSASV
jgi:hypothetical protein